MQRTGEGAALRLRPELREALDELVTFLADRLGDDFVALALFGSCARGTPRETSDVDLLLIARNLNPRLWTRDCEVAELTCGIGPPGKSIIAKTPEEFLRGFPSYYLDLGLDAVVLHDTDGFLARALARIREIIEQAGLRRRWLDDEQREYAWEWTGPGPVPGKWSITWEGFDDGR